MSNRLPDTQVAIIGAGVIGCAMAAKISEFFRVTLIERHDTVAQETSGRNSGVLHSGIHLPPTSNKAALARRGKRLAEEFCHRHSVPCLPVGMHIVVPKQGLRHYWREFGRLRNMLARAKEQNIRVDFVSDRTIRRHEPCIDARFGLYIPEVSIVDAITMTKVLHATAMASSRTTTLFGETVTGLRAVPSGWEITTSNHQLTADCVINAAGLYADQIARLAGFQYQQFFYRGEYYRIREASGLRLNGLVYPVHQPGKPGLGVHLTRTVDNQMLIGPNAKPVSGPSDYDGDLTDPLEFYADVKPFVPDLELAHLAPHPAGIRPKLSDTPGENNFIIAWDSKTFLNLIGIESPGLTAAMAIAADVNHDLLHRLPML